MGLGPVGRVVAAVGGEIVEAEADIDRDAPKRWALGCVFAYSGPGASSRNLAFTFSCNFVCVS